MSKKTIYKNQEDYLLKETTTLEINDSFVEFKFTDEELCFYKNKDILDLSELEQIFSEIPDPSEIYDPETYLIRVFLVETSLFLYVFKKHKEIKDSCRGTRQEKLELEATLSSMYQSGKKLSDILLKEMVGNGMINLDTQTEDLLKKFSETRNKIIEHNFNPRINIEGKLAPIFTNLAHSITTTDCVFNYRFLDKVANKERVGVINYYKDFFEMQDIIKDTLKQIEKWNQNKV